MKDLTESRHRTAAPEIVCEDRECGRKRIVALRDIMPRAVRNIFDQYVQQNNRLTHALAVCLDEDRVLLRRLPKWIDVAAPAHVRSRWRFRAQMKLPP